MHPGGTRQVGQVEAGVGIGEGGKAQRYRE